ncbi:MAG: LysR family transcriptional regulator [Alphaproteobacteria bacterium]|nr:LysR family transcriptional regulator [Alphaproteobacteria bacterium]MBF0128798.1 LysR family transcriptional regulator [Alphaproteobacteria bacterium]
MDWDKLRIFHAVAEAGSFTHAGERLNLSQSAISRQIGALEESLDVSLFHRHARGLILTEQGDLLYRTVHDVFAQLSQVEARLGENKDRPEGPLTITTTVAFGSLWLTPRLRQFLEMYPDIEVNLLLNDSELDLGMREADVAIRFSPPRQPNLIQRHLYTLRYQVYASTEYLKKYGMPRSPDDLGNHRIITYGDDGKLPAGNVNWLLHAMAKEGEKRRPVLRVNNIYGIFRAVRSGLGIAALPEYFDHEAPNLVQVLPELKGPAVDAYFVYPEELRHTKRIVVFRDFLIRKLSEETD